MIEIQVGQGAQAAAAQAMPAHNIDEEFREIYGLERGEDMVIASRLKDVESPAELENLVRRLKEDMQELQRLMTHNSVYARQTVPEYARRPKHPKRYNGLYANY